MIIVSCTENPQRKYEKAVMELVYSFALKINIFKYVFY